MQAILDSVRNLPPYHLLCYGSLLGTEIYQSFVNTKICYQALPMRKFIVLHNRVFPAYFRCQTGLALLTAVTRPPYRLGSFAKHPLDAIPMVIVFVTGILNWFVYGPRTSRTAVVRRTLQAQANEGSNPNPTDPGKLDRVNRRFSRNHAMSIHLNAIALVASVWYAFSLSSSMANGL